jgi:hypothetical protein
MTKREVRLRLQELKLLKGSTLMLSIVQAIGEQVITKAQLEDPLWCASSDYKRLVEEGRQDDERVVCVWFDRKSNSYKWEI